MVNSEFIEKKTYYIKMERKRSSQKSPKRSSPVSFKNLGIDLMSQITGLLEPIDVASWKLSSKTMKKKIEDIPIYNDPANVTFQKIKKIGDKLNTENLVTRIAFKSTRGDLKFDIILNLRQLIGSDKSDSLLHEYKRPEIIKKFRNSLGKKDDHIVFDVQKAVIEGEGKKFDFPSSEMKLAYDKKTNKAMITIESKKGGLFFTFDMNIDQWLIALQDIENHIILAEFKNDNYPLAAVFYAKDVIKGRWREAEPFILESNNPLIKFLYAKDVIKGRWYEAEPYIVKAYIDKVESYYNIYEDYIRNFKIDENDKKDNIYIIRKALDKVKKDRKSRTTRK